MYTASFKIIQIVIVHDFVQVLVNNTCATIEIMPKVNHYAKEKTESESVILELKNILDKLRQCTIMVLLLLLLLPFTYHPVIHLGFLYP
jgi:hypothetical protein